MYSLIIIKFLPANNSSVNIVVSVPSNSTLTHPEIQAYQASSASQVNTNYNPAAERGYQDSANRKPFVSGQSYPLSNLEHQSNNAPQPNNAPRPIYVPEPYTQEMDHTSQYITEDNW